MEAFNGEHRTRSGLGIAADAVSWTATRSGGPGGQHANTSDTAVTVTIDVTRAGLHPSIVERVLGRVGPQISATNAESRSQRRNRAAALATALERLDVAAAPPPRPRRPTKPSRGAVAERLQAKRRRALAKRDRRAPSSDE